jgi:hypothetical protein
MKVLNNLYNDLNIIIAALSGSRSEELEHIDTLMAQNPDSISHKEKVLIWIHRLMQRLGFFGIFLFASVSIIKHV